MKRHRQDPERAVAVTITPLAGLAMRRVKALLSLREGRDITDAEAVAFALCGTSGALNEEPKGR